MKRIFPVHYVLGLAGVALIRNWLAGGEAAQNCSDELFRLTNAFAEDAALRFELDIPDMEAGSGYELWADTYDDLHNPLIAIEQPEIDRILDAISPGRALDAACGTGRYTRCLQSRGHQVSAVDASAMMLEKARAAVPDADFRIGQLEALPYDTASFDLVMCGLALTHLPRISPAIAEIARVLKPGGIAILSDHHPVAGMLGGSAIFQDADRRFRNVTSYIHNVSEYVTAFREAGLRIHDCMEPLLTEDAFARSPLYQISPEAYRKGSAGLPMALIWILKRET
jgi:ubiquinone/menaquinone biosynthesis C-methylase UbiE